MSFIAQGKILETALAIVMLAVTLYFLSSAIRGKVRQYRSLPAMEAISDCVDRAVETGTPVLMSLGAYAYLSGLYAAMTISGVNVFRYATRICIRKGAPPMYVIPMNPEVQPLVDGIYKEVCVAEGKPEAYKRENVFYFGNDEPAYRSGVCNLVVMERPAAYVLVGAITGTGDYIATGAAKSVGAIIVGGEARTTHQIYALVYDYYMYVSDIYAAGPIVSGDQIMLSSLVSGDVLTYITAAIIIAGAVLTLAGLPFTSWIKI